VVSLLQVFLPKLGILQHIFCILLYRYVIIIMSRDSSVGIATGYGLHGPGSIPGRVSFLSYSRRPDHPEVGSTGVKRQRRESDHSPPSSAEVKKAGAIPPLPHASSWLN
jgi:hypothetical protein